MSRKFDAKQIVLRMHPDNHEEGADLLLGFLNASRSDFEYEEGMTVEEYIYGNLAEPVQE